MLWSGSKWKCVNISFSCMVGKIHILYNLLSLSSVQLVLLFNRCLVWLFATLWTAACQASLSFPNSQNLLKLMSIESVMRSSHFILWCPLLLLRSTFPASGSFPMSQFFASGGQSIGVSASVSVLPMNLQSWFPLGLTGLISLMPKWLSRVFSSTTVESINFGALSLLYGPTLTSEHDYWENHTVTIWIFVTKVMSLLFNMLSRIVIAFLPRSKCLNFMAAVPICSDFGAQKNKTCHYFQFFPSICMKWWDQMLWSYLLFFWMLSFKLAFSLSSLTFIKKLFSYSSLSAIKLVSSEYLRLLIFLLAVLIPTCTSSSPTFCMKLNKQGDSIQLWLLISQFWTSLLFYVQF